MDANRRSAVLFWVLALGLVVVLWAFPFVPTQDGPSHQANARILLRYWAPDTPYAERYEVRAEPIPNWLSHVLLAGLMLVVPAAIAEKLVLTGYALGFAWTYRRLALAYHPQSLVVPLLGVLLCYSRSFWMGFFNYGLSLVVLFGALSFLVSRRRLAWRDVSLLASLSLLAYFAHLLGYLLLLAAAALVIAWQYEERWSNLGKALLAVLPSLALTTWYFAASGTGSPSVVGPWLQSTRAWLFSAKAVDIIEAEGTALATQTFGPLALGPFPLGLALAALLLAMFFATLVRELLAEAEPPRPPRGPMLVVLTLTGLAYFVGPEHLGVEHGGYFKQRFALLLPLWLGLVLREPVSAGPRAALLALLLLVYGGLHVNLWPYVAARNDELREYTAGRHLIGPGQAFFVMQPPTHRLKTSDPLLHAADYYGSEADAFNLDNYEAATNHFPIRYRAGHTRALGPFAAYPHRDRVDAVLVWDLSIPASDPAFRDFDLAFASGRLRIFSRKGDGAAP